MGKGFFTMTFVGVLACGMASAEFTVRLQTGRGGRLIVPVWINESGPYHFLLDTGATTTVLDSRLAKRLDLKPERSARVKTFAGDTHLPLAAVDKVAVGPTWLADLEVLVVDLAELVGLERRIQGVLGEDVLARFNYLLDRRNLTISFEEDGELHPDLLGERVPMESRGGMPCVFARAQEPEPLRLIIDSGIPYPVFYEDAAARLGLLPIPGAGQGLAAESDFGRRQLKVRLVPVLSIGQVTLKRLTVYITSRLEPGPPEDGMLPLTLFDSIYVNNLEAFVIFNPQRGSTPR